MVYAINQETDNFLLICSRLESAVTFTLVRFLYNFAIIYLTSSSIVVVCVVGLCISQLLKKTSSTKISLLSIFSKLSLLLLSQTIIATASVVLHLDTPKSHFSTFFVLLNTTCILIFVSIIPQYFAQLNYIERSVTLILYMYADIAENLIQISSLRSILFVLALFIHFVLQTPNHFLSLNTKHSNFLYWIRALNMVCVDILLNFHKILFDRNDSILTDGCLIYLILMLLDAAAKCSNLFQESRDYAVWKSGKLLFLLIQSQFPSTDVVLTALIVVLIVQISSKQYGTNSELFILITINFLLDILQEHIQTLTGEDKAIILFLYLLFISLISFVLNIPDGS